MCQKLKFYIRGDRNDSRTLGVFVAQDVRELYIERLFRLRRWMERYGTRFQEKAFERNLIKETYIGIAIDYTLCIYMIRDKIYTKCKWRRFYGTTN